MRRTTHLIVALTLLFAATGCGLKDLRPDAARQEVSDSARQRGRALIDNLPNAHGGLETWQSFETTRYVFTDHWQGGLERAMFMPWLSSGVRMELAVLQGEDDGRLTFLEGEQEGHAWGIQNWATYTVEPDGEPVFDEDDDIEFWLPTTAYFFEAPFRLREATVVYDIGPETLGDTTYDRVFISWETDKPQEKTDQYIAWIDGETGRLAFLEYTIRDMMGSIAGCMAFDEYETFSGLAIATKMTTVDEPGGKPNLHAYEIFDVEFGADFERPFVEPRPELSEPKHSE